MTPTDNCRERGVSDFFGKERNQTHIKTSPPRQNKTRGFRSEYFIRIALPAVVYLREKSFTNSGWLRKYFIKYKSPPILDELIGAISNIFFIKDERRALIRSA
mgnify:FL=1|tara:strand:+ start:1922 stop:2230 length:309 start_codon:yes stop_codon:yes gene_type:complete